MSEPKNYGGEQVLAISRSTLCALFGLTELPTAFIPDYELKALGGIMSNAVFVDRTMAETTPSLKQIIPYAVIQHKGKILTYRRGKSGGENRLHGKVSLGVGGHINPEDAQPIQIEGHLIQTQCLVALIRELREELKVDIADVAQVRFMGYVNEEVNPTGHVHLGIIYVVHLPDDTEFEFEDCLTEPLWVYPAELHPSTALSLELEYWSGQLIDEFDVLATSANWTAPNRLCL